MRRPTIVLAVLLATALASAADPAGFRVVTWQLGRDGAPAEAKLVAAELTKLGPDVVLLQGVRRDGADALDHAGAIAKEMGFLHVFLPVVEEGGRARGLAILAKAQPRAAEGHELPAGAERALALSAIVSVPAPGGREREIAVVSVAFNGSSTQRFTQAIKLVEHLREIERACVCGGDLGGDDAGQALKILRNAGVGFLAKSELAATWPADKPMDERDHLLQRPASAFVPVACQVAGETSLADHRAVLAILAWGNR